MLTNSAHQIIKIVSGRYYGIDVSKNNEGPIYRIHALQTNTDNVKIKLYGGEPIMFPAGAFIQGAVYDMFIKEMEFKEGTASFVGYKYKTRPFSLEL
jgi:hypothetical protein